MLIIINFKQYHPHANASLAVTNVCYRGVNVNEISILARPGRGTETKRDMGVEQRPSETWAWDREQARHGRGTEIKRDMGVGQRP